MTKLTEWVVWYRTEDEPWHPLMKDASRFDASCWSDELKRAARGMERIADSVVLPEGEVPTS